MSGTNTVAEAAPVEILAEWEGPANAAPGTVFEEAQAKHLSAEIEVAAIAGWIAAAALSGVIGNTTHEAIKKKVVGVLAAWRRRFGKRKIDEIKQELFEQMEQCRNNRKITDEELKQRIERLFDDI